MEGKNQFEAENIFWFGTIAQKPAIRIDGIGDQIVMLTQLINGTKRTIFIDTDFLPLLAKELLNIKLNFDATDK
jgi:hypothetical protein